MRWWIAVVIVFFVSESAGAAGAPKLDPEQAANALIAFSIAAGKCNKSMIDPNGSLDPALSKFGYKTADFMPGGRYIKLMDAAVERVTKSIKTTGLTLTCLEAVNLVEHTLPGLLAVPAQWRAHFLWHINGVDKLRTDMRIYRRFAQEGETARNIFVLTCPKTDSRTDQQFELEVIPPISELERLKTLAQGREVATSVTLSSRDRSIVTAGHADGIAGWINFTDQELPGIVELVSQKDLRVSLFESGLEYRFSSDMAASEKINGIFSENRANLEKVGGLQTMSSADVIRDCRSFRSAR